MKKLSKLLCTCIVIAGTFTACKKDNNNNNNNNPAGTPETPFVTATVGSRHFSGMGFEHANGTFSAHDTLAGLLGTDTLLKTGIAIDIQNYKGPGTYDLNGSANTVFYDSMAGGRDVMGAYGTMTITDTTTYIKGTFSFTLIDSTKVTNGAFLLLKQ